MNNQKPGKKNKALWRRPRRLLRYYRLKLVRQQAPPESIARGLAAGVFVGLMPIVPFHTVSALGLACLFRCSKVAALLGTLVANPLDLIPRYMLVYYLGRKALPMASPSFDFDKFDMRAIAGEGWELLAVLMTGGLIVAVPAALAVYFICLWAVRKHRARSGPA